MENKFEKILVLGAGAIVIGQGAEFDYAGSQACKLLKELGKEVILLNDNPATMMTDKDLVEKVYFWPLEFPWLLKLIKKERPDAILASLGGQTALNLLLELEEKKVLEKYAIKVLGTPLDSIKKCEDRSLFKKEMEKMAMPLAKSRIVDNLFEAKKVLEDLTFPLVLRTAYTLGGSGGGIAYSAEDFFKMVEKALEESPIEQIIVEEAFIGYQELEFELVRDYWGRSSFLCDLENIDPVGIHTGDSLVVSPSQTLSQKDRQFFQGLAKKIINELGVVGACNLQIAFKEESQEFFIIEVNPRVSRSSALASKIRGLEIASISVLLSLGYSLSEVEEMGFLEAEKEENKELDYVGVKFPTWSFEKLGLEKRSLKTSMQATGEVLGLGADFPEAFLSAYQSFLSSDDSLFVKDFSSLTDACLEENLALASSERIYYLAEAFQRGMELEKIAKLTKIKSQLLGLMKESFLKKAEILQKKELRSMQEYFKKEVSREKKAILLIGSGSNKIGQGLEFDYSATKALRTIRKKGYRAIFLNNNPATVSTDFNESDSLYLAPIELETILEIARREGLRDLILQFSGQIGLNLARDLEEAGLNILGTKALGIDLAEDRASFEKLALRSGFSVARGLEVKSGQDLDQALKKLSFPLMLRPSYVIGGRSMKIVRNQKELAEFLKTFDFFNSEKTIFLDEFIEGIELDVDLIADGKDIFLLGILEHLEKSGVHSGDSRGIYPAISLSALELAKIREIAKSLAEILEIKGFFNIQFIISQGKIYVLEVNPRASRTIPLFSKAKKIDYVDLATRVILGEKLEKYLGLESQNEEVAFIKLPVFSFSKLGMKMPSLSPEMKSTGERMYFLDDFQNIKKRIV